jgi:hypothetical protein
MRVLKAKETTGAWINNSHEQKKELFLMSANISDDNAYI